MIITVRPTTRTPQDYAMAIWSTRVEGKRRKQDNQVCRRSLEWRKYKSSLLDEYKIDAIYPQASPNDGTLDRKLRRYFLNFALILFMQVSLSTRMRHLSGTFSRKELCTSASS